MTEDDCTRVYTRTGKLAHLLGPFDSPNHGYAFALCGLQPRLFDDWLGTGSQREHERAAELPVCPRCGRKLAMSNA